MCCSLSLALQQPIDDQASDVADIVSDPAVVDAETFSVAAEIVSDLFSGAVTNANVRSLLNTLCVCYDTVYNTKTGT